ncbi:MAG: hypothetical protein JEZ08_06045 [Clostridiales bacterium]|nr:hypothetical protein [Clostridiales bacterium]
MPVIEQDALDVMNECIKNELASLLIEKNYNAIDGCLENIIINLHQSIPDRKRISYGITYVVKTFVKDLYKWLEESEFDTLDIADMIYENMKTFRTKCIGLGIISHIGVKDVEAALPYFYHASTHEMWEVREFAQMYIRKITKVYPKRIQEFLYSLALSEDPNQRRYASEALRPVTENKWINDKPEFSLKVLRVLFEESDEYPRTSVGNNLSDLSKKQPELIFDIVKELVSTGNENSWWIAHRACRNLVVKEPIRVMDLLNLDRYKYKTKQYNRSDYI